MRDTTSPAYQLAKWMEQRDQQDFDDLIEAFADARRYRWLMRDGGHNALMVMLASLCATEDPIKPQLDAAIDAAMKEQK